MTTFRYSCCSKSVLSINRTGQDHSEPDLVKAFKNYLFTSISKAVNVSWNCTHICVFIQNIKPHKNRNRNKPPVRLWHKLQTLFPFKSGRSVNFAGVWVYSQAEKADCWILVSRNLQPWQRANTKPHPLCGWGHLGEGDPAHKGPRGVLCSHGD